MLDKKALERLGAWIGYRLYRVVWQEVPGGTVELYLKPTAKVMHCQRCGSRRREIRGTVVRRVRDMPLFEHHMVLVVSRRRAWCEQCGGPQLGRLIWLSRYQRSSDQLAEACSELLRGASVQAVARFYALIWHTLKAVGKARLAAHVAAPDWTNVHYLAMNEFALRKGHRYATVVIDPIRRQVLWVGPGQSRETARAFFAQLPEGAAARVEAVAIDMATASELEIKANCPNAEVVFDLFHVVARYGREVIDRARVNEANRLREDRTARQVVKPSRWLLLRNRDNLTREQTVKLDELVAANQSLLTVYLLRDELKRLWRYRRQGWAKKAWAQWYQRATDSGIDALQSFAECLKPYLRGILARCQHPLHTSVLEEGINNTIKAIERRAYGHWDEEYFFLKICATFPGIQR